MLDCLILFLHHDDSAVTRRHLALLRGNNPWPVVALCNGSSSKVEGAIDVAKLSSRWAGEDPWRGADSMIYRWFAHQPLAARRYVVMEWDALATMPVSAYLEEVWDQDAAAANVHMPATRPDWPWFNELPAELRPFAAGVSPLNGVLISHRALAAVVGGEIPENLYSECRLGTLLRKAGFMPTSLPRAKAETNSFHPGHVLVNPRAPGIYHPVKRVYVLDPETEQRLAGV